MYTTKEAAQRLGISMRRVNALIASGDLEAQRFGRSWMLDERSVHESESADPAEQFTGLARGQTTGLQIVQACDIADHGRGIGTVDVHQLLEL